LRTHAEYATAVSVPDPPALGEDDADPLGELMLATPGPPELSPLHAANISMDATVNIRTGCLGFMFRSRFDLLRALRPDWF
jgi:hypothetical protein